MSVSTNPEIGKESARGSTEGLFGRIYTSVLERFRKGGNSRSPWDFSEHNILPYRTREALRNFEQTLAGPEIADLARMPAYAPSAFYLLVKGLESNRKAQQDLLSQAVEAEARGVDYTGQISDIVVSNATLLGSERVKAAKISQISRMGPELWEQRFNKIGEDLTTDHKGREKFVLAYAALVGFRQIAKFSRESGERVNLLVEGWYQDPAEEYCGYAIDASKGRVSPLSRDFRRPQDFVTIDDTVSTWGHFRRMWAFILEQDPLDVVIDPSRTMVIDKTSTDNTANAPRKLNPQDLLMG